MRTRLISISGALLLCLMLMTLPQQSAQAQRTNPLPFFDVNNPATLVAAYYNAITLRDYNRAYNYWETPPRGATLQQFANGFASTASAAAIIRLPYSEGVAAGSSYADVPTLVIARTTGGTAQYFYGCFTARKSNVPVGNATQADPAWHIYNATLRAIGSPDLDLLGAACQNSVGLYTNVIDYPMSPVELTTSFFNALAFRDYVRAYNYWETPPRGQSYQQFANGYAQTASVAVYLYTDGITEDAGAGSVYSNLPLLVFSNLNNGTQQFFAGCYTGHHSNVPVGNAIQPDPRWFFRSASVQTASSASNAITRVMTVCPSG